VNAYVRLQLPFYETSEKGNHDEKEDIKPVGTSGTWWHEALRMLGAIEESVHLSHPLYSQEDRLPLSASASTWSFFVSGSLMDLTPTGASVCDQLRDPARRSSLLDIISHVIHHRCLGLRLSKETHEDDVGSSVDSDSSMSAHRSPVVGHLANTPRTLFTLTTLLALHGHVQNGWLTSVGKRPIPLLEKKLCSTIARARSRKSREWYPPIRK
jgi:hypothetical protein